MADRGDLRVIRQAIATRLIAGLDGSDPAWNVSPVVLGQPPVPSLVVMKGPTKYDEAMGLGTLTKLTLIVVAYVNLVVTDESQDLLDELLSPVGDHSVYQILMAPDHNSQVRLISDDEPDGVISDLDVTDDIGHKVFKIGGTSYLGTQWNLEVWT